ncbi:uncharacterized protein STEHIDRAFT_136385 [Stereum hirsutum FP-91666 SS1]|uniref:uncharacterized protein n=1 Tax=Stereum hirsutum (strain FP-91666) TaxID=721885 RepID=UPI000440BAD1|nr:uncharacterized protein STEHIDRAFT_136385 [Stereum hirsutum FP-91666 SS1]EIM92535.1 hypothetical protein STEHIDRAFT_136385 [Stereum hirsutum FP-91666 SS1]
MATVDTWDDFETLKQGIRHNTVDRLKHIVAGFNEENFTMLSKTGKKQDLIERITGCMDLWKANRDVDKWTKARGVLYQVRNAGQYKHGGYTPYMPNTKPFASNAAAAAGPSTVTPWQTYNGNTTIRKTVPAIPGAMGAASSQKLPPRFRPSPFFNVEQMVSNFAECPESTSGVDRRQQSVSFTLTNEQVEKLKSTSSPHQLRLYCTSSSYYAPASFRATSGPCPIEFPPTCEVRVNGTQITANMKGLKKKPGTAPPADLTKFTRMQAGVPSKVEMVYVNSQQNNNQQPAPPKKYYIAVMLVKVTSVDQLITTLKATKRKTSEEILAKMRASVSDDDDIVAGPVKMSVKCPLSYMRISTPCRAIQCVHPQCFDALSWYSVNEQTTTWSCPICEKPVNHEDLIVDGYFDHILKATPEEVEDVMVEADGEWHTSDNMYASPAWKATHKPPPPALSLPPTPEKKPHLNGNGKSNDKEPEQEVFVLDDSDDEEEGQVKRELSFSVRQDSSALSNDSGPPDSQVIDLTLDSDEDEPAPPPSLASSNGKRKALDDLPSPTEQIWKKSRVQDASHTVMRSVGNSAPRI